MNNEEQKIGLNNSPYRENVSAPDLTERELEQVAKETFRPAPEDWEAKFDRDHKPKIQSHGEDCKAVVNLKAFIRSEKAAARREGAERAVEFLESLPDKHYPEDIFIPLPNGGKEVYATVHECLKARGGTIDALSADYARRFIRLAAKDLKEFIAEEDAARSEGVNG